MIIRALIVTMLLLFCAGCMPTQVPEVRTQEYFYKIAALPQGIEELERNLNRYAARCGAIVSQASNRFERTGDNTAILTARNGNQIMFVAEAKEEDGQTAITLWGGNWRFMEYFCNALENGACIDSYYDPRLKEHKGGQ